MQRSLVRALVLSSSLILTSFAAAAPPAPASSATLRVDLPLPAVTVGTPVADSRVASSPLGFVLAASADGVDTWATVEFEIHAGSQRIVHERFAALAGATARQVEILSRQPQRRDRLAALDRLRGDLEAVVRVDGVEAARGPLSTWTLTAPSPDLPLADLRFSRDPAATPEGGFLFTAEASCTQLTPCLDDCETERQACALTGCPADLLPGFCEECEFAYLDCRNACQNGCGCTGIEEVYTVEEQTLVNYTFNGSACFEDRHETDWEYGHIYNDATSTYRDDVVEVTAYCNGSESRQVISSSYSIRRCWVQSWLTCAGPRQWAPACNA